MYTINFRTVKKRKEHSYFLCLKHGHRQRKSHSIFLFFFLTGIERWLSGLSAYCARMRNQSSALQYPYKSWKWWLLSTTPEMESNLSSWWAPGPMWDPLSKHKLEHNWRRHPVLILSLHMHVNPHAHMYNTHKQAHTIFTYMHKSWNLKLKVKLDLLHNYKFALFRKIGNDF